MKTSYAIAVTSGKGGVGKSVLSVNLALALRKQGKRVVLFDADLSLANAHIIMGVQPERTIVDTLDGAMSLSDVCTQGPLGVRLVSGGNGLSEMMNVSPVLRRSIINSFRGLSAEADYLVVDTAGGVDDNVLDFVHACDRILVVVVGEPAAFIDAYACIKVLSQTGQATNFDVVVNKVRDDAHGRDVFRQFRAIVDRFLSVNVHHMASIPDDSNIHTSVSHCNPVLFSASSSRAARAIEGLAYKLIKDTDAPAREEGNTFFLLEAARVVSG